MTDIEPSIPDYRMGEMLIGTSGNPEGSKNLHPVVQSLEQFEVSIYIIGIDQVISSNQHKNPAAEWLREQRPTRFPVGTHQLAPVPGSVNPVTQDHCFSLDGE